MPRTHRAALIVFALASTAFAGFTSRDVPPPLRAGQGRPVGYAPRGLAAVKATGRSLPARAMPVSPRLPLLSSFSAPVVAMRAINQAGQVLDVTLEQPLDLSQPLPVPPGAVDLELTLGGPIEVWVEDARGLRVRNIDVSTFTVALEDPDATAELEQVLVDLDVAALLDAPTDEQALALLQDGAVAVPW